MPDPTLHMKAVIDGTEEAQAKLKGVEQAGTQAAQNIDKDMQKAGQNMLEVAQKINRAGALMNQYVTLPLLAVAGAATKVTLDVLKSQDAIGQMSMEGQRNVAILNGSIAEMQQEWLAVRVEIAEAVIPVMNDFVDMVTNTMLPAMERMIEKWGEQTTAAKETQITIGAIIALAGPFTSFASDIVAGFALIKMAALGSTVALWGVYAAFAAVMAAIVAWQLAPTAEETAREQGINRLQAIGARAAAEEQARTGAQPLTQAEVDAWNRTGTAAETGTHTMAEWSQITGRPMAPPSPTIPETTPWGTPVLPRLGGGGGGGPLPSLTPSEPPEYSIVHPFAEALVADIVSNLYVSYFGSIQDQVDQILAHDLDQAIEAMAGRYDPRTPGVGLPGGGGFFSYPAQPEPLADFLDRLHAKRHATRPVETRVGVPTWQRNDWLWGAGIQAAQVAAGQDDWTSMLPIAGSAFGPVGAAVGGLLGMLFGHKKQRGDTAQNPVYVKDINTGNLLTELMNITKSQISRVGAGVIDRLSADLHMQSMSRGLT